MYPLSERPCVSGELQSIRIERLRHERALAQEDQVAVRVRGVGSSFNQKLWRFLRIERGNVDPAKICRASRQASERRVKKMTAVG
jgi:hypothetical protein